jgi:hypothetical protein
MARASSMAMGWYESKRPGLGAELLGSVHGVMVRVAEAPGQFHVWADNPRFRKAVASRFPYALFFYIVGDTPVIVVVAHSSRRPASGSIEP